MSEEDQQFLQRLLEAFQIEAREHVEAMSAGLLELEAGPPQERTARIIETIFREAHSLKGAARAVDSRPIETVCQALESVFSAWKRRSLGPRPDQFDVIHRAVNLVAALLQPGSPPRQASIADSVEALRRLAEGPPTQPAPSSTSAPAPAPPDPEPVSAPVEEPIESRAGEESVRISTAKLDSVLLQAEELLAAKLAGAQRVKDFREVLTELARVRHEWSRTCAELRRGPELGARALESALDSHSIRLEAFETRVRTLVQVTGRFQRGVGTLVDKLLEGAKRLVMLPAGRILEGFPRLIRELARDQNKDVQLTLRGHEVEVDKRILEEMKGPLLHMLRNCVDH
jgi:two-component system chemotaxis sensor kinase CheA